MTMENDVLSQLLPASWRGVPFPILSWSVGWSHDSVEHKPYRKKVSNVEDTGLNSRVFSFEIPFRNGIVPGPAEEKLRGKVLFPYLLMKFVDEFNKDDSGILVHPLFGPVNCKSGEIKLASDGKKRDGIEVQATFKESDDSAEGTAPKPDTPAVVHGMAMDADALDAELGSLNPPLEHEDGVPFASFSQIGALLRAPYDTASMLSMRFTNANSAMAAELTRLKEAVYRANDVNLWPINDLITKLRNALADMQSGSGGTSARMMRYVVPKEMTLGEISTLLNVSIEDLLASNPMIADEPLVRRGVQIIYVRK